MEPTKEQIDTLKSEHGDNLRKVTVAEEVVIVRRCTGGEYDRFMSRAEEGKKAQGIKELARSCIVFPYGDSLASLLAEKGGVVLSCINPILEMYGVDEKAEVEKL